MPKLRRNTSDAPSAKHEPVMATTDAGLNQKARPMLLWTLATLVVIALIASAYWLRRQSFLRGLETQCQVARELEKWDELEQLAVDWGIYAPLNPIPFEHAAIAAYRLGAIDRAYGYLTQMPENGTLESWLLKGQIELESLNDPLSSLESCNKSITIDPANSEAHQRLMYFRAMSRQVGLLKSEIERGIKSGAATLETYAYWFALDKLQFADAAPVNKGWAEMYPQQDAFQIATVLALANLPQFTELQREGDLKILEDDFPTIPKCCLRRSKEQSIEVMIFELISCWNPNPMCSKGTIVIGDPKAGWSRHEIILISLKQLLRKLSKWLPWIGKRKTSGLLCFVSRVVTLHVSKSFRNKHKRAEHFSNKSRGRIAFSVSHSISTAN